MTAFPATQLLRIDAYYSAGVNRPQSSESNIVVFYGSNAWACTRPGKITGLSGGELRELPGGGDVAVTPALVI